MHLSRRGTIERLQGVEWLEGREWFPSRRAIARLLRRVVRSLSRTAGFFLNGLFVRTLRRTHSGDSSLDVVERLVAPADDPQIVRLEGGELLLESRQVEFPFNELALQFLQLRPLPVELPFFRGPGLDRLQLSIGVSRSTAS